MATLKRSDSIADNMPEAFKQSRYHMKRCFEAAVNPPHVAFSIRPSPGFWEFVKVNSADLSVEGITATDYLKFKEMIYDDNWANDANALEVDFGAFDFSVPHLTLSSSIGNGLGFVSKFVTSKLSGSLESAQPLVDYLLSLNHEGEKLMINETLGTVRKLQMALIVAEVYLSGLPKDTLYQNFEIRVGFEKGWGNTAERVKETMRFLSEVLQAPDPSNMENFFSRLPTVFNVVIFSPHGYFGQADVLGLPDTGGQVVYILDQVKALEDELLLRIEHQGLNIKPQIIVVMQSGIESINGTKHSIILRVPFSIENRVLRQWVSRFDVYPYLEKFTQDVIAKILDLMEGKPDLIIGNYTDGNLAATLMAMKELDPKYHFSCQYMADTIAMNATDFIIASTYQEIAGSMKPYFITLPGLCRVVSGINVFDPKFNIAAPGADQSVYFPYTEKQSRFTQFILRLKNCCLAKCGYLEDKKKPIIFSMARLDTVKNLTGLTAWYGKNKRLRGLVNLVIVGGFFDPNKSKDREEMAEITKIHELIEKYQLKGQFRWIAAQTTEIAMENSLYEAFGLTVIEAMNCGLPTFATNQGGPAEIIVDGISGFHIDPKNGDESSNIISDFFEKCKVDPGYWNKFSAEGSMQQILNMGSMYSFWRQLNKEQKLAKQRYIQMLYNLQFRDWYELSTKATPSIIIMKPSRNSRNYNNETLKKQPEFFILVPRTELLQKFYYQKPQINMF
ncbi:sucrose synthase [Salix suchowensis]|nr:sucrose synthase [Salix suchowensis]